ncbi:Holliday junction resolvase RecU [bioreactor metagenome]|uniref:Holliday junction resolvase RecU n=1 Tax=bioreactor metagenome TaxID=1076179 RepID=A0A645EXI7_9ZZZZ|nr:Holliday junction resolvase RecU [Oscillospiraceae bacterium]
MNKASGRNFEELIEASNEHYRMLGRAEISKTPEPMKPIKSCGKGRFVACFEKRAQPDFKGVIAGGRTVCFEAKHTDQEHIFQSVVNTEQTISLNRHMKLGAECFVLVSFGFYEFFRIPWGVWVNMKTIYGHKYITPKEAYQYKILLKNGVLDYLKAEDINT